MSKCEGINCNACEDNGYDHSQECLLEYEHTVDMNRVSVSLSQMKYWVDQLETYASFPIAAVIEAMNGYIETKERDGVEPE